MVKTFGKVTLHEGDNRAAIATLSDGSIDSCVTDPPYALVSISKRFGADNAAPAAPGVYGRSSAGFMGKKWDTGEVAFDPSFWAEVLRVLKPGGHLVAFGGTRTYHRLAVAIEDAGFEIRDQLGWVYGTGFPKSHSVSKAIDRELGVPREKVRDYNPRNPKATGNGTDGMSGATRPWIEAALERGYHEIDGDVPATAAAAMWQGWGTALKPAWEPIVLARKPLIGTVAENVLAHGTGALNIDGCRVEGALESGRSKSGSKASENIAMSGANYEREPKPDSPLGRWPANIILSWPEDQYALRRDIPAEQKAEVYRWLSENP